jgi:hypothetical protein
MATFPVNGTWLPTFVSTYPVPNIADGTTVNTDIPAPFPCRLLDGQFTKNAGAANAGDLIQVIKSGNVCLNLDIGGVTAESITRADGSQNVSLPEGTKWAAGETIRISVSSAGAGDTGGLLVLTWEQLQG